MDIGAAARAAGVVHADAADARSGGRTWTIRGLGPLHLPRTRLLPAASFRTHGAFGAVCAGANPAVGTGERPRIDHDPGPFAVRELIDWAGHGRRGDRVW